ncbi:MAG TPA: SHOCT domain-containing protein [Stellaceae bacterium]|jgi:putative membrane protein|nr:SHOCT domain-containing protein [Stellaceae bacterium]
MMHWWWDSGALPWFGMILGPLIMFGGLALAVLVVVYLVRALGPGPTRPDPERSALDILQERFARGEIDRAEYEDRKRTLSAS